MSSYYTFDSRNPYNYSRSEDNINDSDYNTYHSSSVKLAPSNTSDEHRIAIQPQQPTSLDSTVTSDSPLNSQYYNARTEDNTPPATSPNNSSSHNQQMVTSYQHLQHDDLDDGTETETQLSAEEEEELMQLTYKQQVQHTKQVRVRQRLSFLAAVFALLAPVITLSYLMRDNNALHYYYSSAIQLLTAATLVALIQTYRISPGQVPQNSAMLNDEDDLPIDEFNQPLRLCPRCSCFQAQLTRHCKYCARCVERFDHDCLVIGSCIGRHNYRWFVLFITAATALAICALTVLLYLAHDLVLDIETKAGASRVTTDMIKHVLSSHRMLCGLLAYSTLLSISLSSLTTYHLYLITVGQTTNAHVRRVYARQRNPHNRGWRRNWLNFFTNRYVDDAITFNQPHRQQSQSQLYTTSTNNKWQQSKTAGKQYATYHDDSVMNYSSQDIVA